MDESVNTTGKSTYQQSHAPSDAEIIGRVRSGEVDAFEIIMRRHNQRLFRIARCIVGEDHEAMDVVQETYVKAYYQLQQFKGPNGFVAWLSRIVKNEAMMRLRLSKYLSYTLDSDEKHAEEVFSPALEPMEELANQQLRKLLEHEIDALPLDLRSVYMLRAIQQLSTRETAQCLEITEDNVKTRYLRAKKHLQASISSYLDEIEVSAFTFAGHRCDAIVSSVLAKIS